MTKAQIDWLLPSTPESILMLDDPAEGLRPKWLAPGLTGDVLQIDDLGRLTWGSAPPSQPAWPLLGPDGTLAAPSYAFASTPGAGMFLDVPGSAVCFNDPLGTRYRLASEDYGPDFASGVHILGRGGHHAYLGLYESAGGTGLSGAYVAVDAPATTFDIYVGDAWWELLSTGEFFPGGAYDLGTPANPIRDLHFSRQILAPDGTAVAPSYSFASTPTVGISLIDIGAEAGSGGLQIRDERGGTFEIGSSAFDETTLTLATVSGATKLQLYASTGFVGFGTSTNEMLGIWTNNQSVLMILNTDGTLTVPGPIRAPDGTAAAPSYSFASAPDVGMSAWDNADGPTTHKSLRFNIEPARGLSAFELFFYGTSITDGLATEFDIVAEDGSSRAWFGLWEQTGGLNEVYLGGDPNLALWAGPYVWRISAATGGFLPDSDNVQDLGDLTHQIRNLYLSGGIFIDGAPLTPGGGGSLTWPLLAPNGTEAAPSYSFAANPGGGFFNPGGGSIGVTTAGTVTHLFNYGFNGELKSGSAGVIAWTAVPSPIAASDVVLARDGPGILAQRNGANPQDFRLYETYTNALNFSRLTFTTAGGVNQIRCEAAGTGTVKQLILNATAGFNFEVAGGRVIVLDPSGLVFPIPNNTWDLGLDPYRFRSLYLGASLNYTALATAPATPPAGSVVTYAKTDKKVYQKDDAGLETLLAGVTWPLLAPNGTYLLPSYTFASAPTDGLYYDGNVSVVATTGILLRAASQNLLYLGGTTPSGWWTIQTNGVLVPGNNNVQDVGDPSFTIRSLYLGTSLDYKVLASAPATPAAGHVITYAKTDKKVYQKNDAGLETLLGGVATTTVVALWMENARFPDGTANNAFPLPVERISTGTPASGVPKLVDLVYQFDAATPEWLIWKGVVPMDYVTSGAVVLVTKWSMLSATTGNIRVSAAGGSVVDGTTDGRALVTGTADVSADQSVPGTLGAQKETRLTITAPNLAAGRKFVLAISLGAGSASSATGDRVLEAAWLEFAR
jgi:hypothetical protein